MLPPPHSSGKLKCLTTPGNNLCPPDGPGTGKRVNGRTRQLMYTHRGGGGGMEGEGDLIPFKGETITVAIKFQEN